MSQDTVLHLCNWDKKFIPPFMEFIHKHFGDDGRHQFVIYGDLQADSMSGMADTAVVYPSLVNNALSLAKRMHQAEKIVLHGLFNNHLLYILALQPWLLKKCYWVIWGGDLYAHKANNKNWRWKKDELFRKFVIKRLGNFLTYVRGDYELAKKRYGAAGRYHECIMYPSNVFSDLPIKSIPHSTVNVQIGNSADSSNNHFEILEKLLPFRDQDIAIYAPLSYGDRDHAKAVIEAGKSKFGDKFIPLTEFMSCEKYIEFQGNIDIAIFNHKRQQGMGNTITLLGLGKKVYMRSDVTPRALFQEIGVKVFDFCKLDLVPISDSVRRNNQTLIRDYFSAKRLWMQLKTVFES